MFDSFCPFWWCSWGLRWHHFAIHIDCIVRFVTKYCWHSSGFQTYFGFAPKHFCHHIFLVTLRMEVVTAHFLISVPCECCDCPACPTVMLPPVKTGWFGIWFWKLEEVFSSMVLRFVLAIPSLTVGHIDSKNITAVIPKLHHNTVVSGTHWHVTFLSMDGQLID